MDRGAATLSAASISTRCVRLDSMLSFPRRRMTKAEFEEYAEDHVNDLNTVSEAGFPQTSFSIARQIDVAFDMYGMFLSAAGRPTLNFAINHGYVTLIKRLEAKDAQQGLEEYEKAMVFSVPAVLAKPKVEAERYFRFLSEGVFVSPPFASYRMPVAVKLAAEITHELIGALIQMPWFEILKTGFSASQAKRRGDGAV